MSAQPEHPLTEAERHALGVAVYGRERGVILQGGPVVDAVARIVAAHRAEVEAERDGWRRDAAAHAARATATGYRLNGVRREHDRLATRLAETERQRDAIESTYQAVTDRVRPIATQHTARVRGTGYGGYVTHCSCGHDDDYADHLQAVITAALTGVSR